MWDPVFSPKAQALFGDAETLARLTPRADYVLEAGIAAEATVWVDGVQNPAGGFESTIGEGWHVVQWKLNGGGFGTTVVQVGAGQAVTVRGRQDVALAAVSGAGSPVDLEAAAEALVRCAGAQSLTSLYLAELGEVTQLHRFDAASGEWHVTDEGAVSERLRARYRRQGGEINTVVGGVALAAGVVVGSTGYVDASGLLGESTVVANTEVFVQNSRAYKYA